MKNSSIYRVVLSAALAIVCILLVQGYWLKNAFDHSERAFQEKVHISLLNVAKQISALQQVQLPTLDLITQIAQDYFIVDIRDAIDANNLQYYLEKEFEAVGLQVDFEYGIYDCDTDQMVYGNYVGNKTQASTTNDLPTYSDYTYYFGVRFPDRKGYVLKQMWLPLLFTGVLFLSILFFIYATYEIFEQKKLADLQKDFINNMTHEFKTPLSSIRVSAEVFLDEPVIKTHHRLLKYAGIIHQQASRLNDQIERVLQIADLSNASIVLRLEPVDLVQIVRDITNQLKSTFEKENAVVHLHIDGQNFQVSADRLHLINVIHNLVDNAIKYKREHPIIDISLAKEPNTNKILLTIADQGLGIEREYISNLKEKFFRVPTGNVHNTKGFGLGLYYVHQILMAHGWSMDVESEPGYGTKVIIGIT